MIDRYLSDKVGPRQWKINILEVYCFKINTVERMFERNVQHLVQHLLCVIVNAFVKKDLKTVKLLVAFHLEEGLIIGNLCLLLCEQKSVKLFLQSLFQLISGLTRRVRWMTFLCLIYQMIKQFKLLIRSISAMAGQKHTKGPDLTM